MALVEVLIATSSRGPGGAQAGDIVAVRKPLGTIGLKEGRRHLVILVEESELPEHPLQTPESGRKNNLNVPLAELARLLVGPPLDMNRLSDPELFYQPVMDGDPATGKLRRQPAPVRLKGVIQGGV